MSKTNDQLLGEALKSSMFLKGYEPNDFEDYHEVYLLRDIPVIAHFHYPKGSLEPGHQIEVIHGDAVVNVLNDKNRLLDFVKAVANGDKKSKVEARLLVGSLKNEHI